MASNTVICVSVVLLASLLTVTALLCHGPGGSEVDCPSDACQFSNVMGTEIHACGVKNPGIGDGKCDTDDLGTKWYTCYSKLCNKKCGSASHQPMMVVLVLAVGAYFMSK